MSTFVSIRQASTIAGVSRRTIYHWLEAGKLTLYRNAGGGIRIIRSELIRKADA